MQNKKMWQHIYIRGRKGKLEINTLLQSYCKNVKLNHQYRQHKHQTRCFTKKKKKKKKHKTKYTYSFNTP